ncbi:phosphorothioated DNA-binding restriction endonuclease [Marinactinospora rubrisoli]|uniref:Phosphorothioated DNA-binding restriction endonuclease n=1 Tax=Marinactinospora rubrisoli TaxID=2715399 RepID=A0ABW2KA09_9ACTN
MDVVERVAGIRMGRSGGGRAPHKPLLLLYALGRFQRSGPGPIRYAEAEGPLKRLIRDFAPPRAGGPYYPFHHLANDDGVWVVSSDRGPGSPGASPKMLRESGAVGRLGPEIVRELVARPEVLPVLARVLLDDNFEPSLHSDICRAVGLDLADAGYTHVPARGGRRRDPVFRVAVLRAYEYMCAFCGYEGRLDDGAAVGLDAAHVRWWAFDGPDSVDNGLCLCALHHKLFDKGVLGLTDDRLIAVSAAFVGRTAAARAQVHALAGRELCGPAPAATGVRTDHIAWHRREVFHGEPRVPA